jgi:hypothetical protein
MNIERDKNGKTRVAKGDKSGLGGQYAPDPAKIADAKQKFEQLNDSLNETVDTPTEVVSPKTVTLLNGETKTLEFGETGYICLLCGEEYTDNRYGYCDETLECAFDSGEHLVKI